MARRAPADVARQIASRRRVRAATGGSVPRRGGRLPKQGSTKPLELEYFGLLLALLERARKYVAFHLIPELGAILRESQRPDAREDARGSARVNELVDRMVEDFWKNTDTGELERIGRRMANATDRHNRKELGKQVAAATGLELDELVGAEPGLGLRISDFVAENVALIKSIPDRYFQEIEFHVIDGVRRGARQEEIAATLQERFNVGRSRAELIARDQVGKFHGELNHARQTAIGVSAYIWRTVRDNRVRSEHDEREGERYTWDDPPEDGHPGEPINCRCYAEPDLSEIMAEVRKVERRR